MAHRVQFALAVAVVASAAEISPLTVTNRVFIPIFMKADKTLTRLTILKRQPVSETLDLVLALGDRKARGGEVPGWWWKENRFGIFLQDRQDAGRVYTLTVEPGPSCEIHLEKITTREVLLSCPASDAWSTTADNQAFFIDIASKRLALRFTYPPFSKYILVQSGNGVSFVAGDRQHLVTVAWDETAGGFRILPNTQAAAILKKITVVNASNLTSHWRLPALLERQRFVFGSRRTFTLVPVTPGSSNNQSIILETRHGKNRTFRLPKTSPDELTAKRPKEPTFEIVEDIGPYQVEEERLWFGKSFYNGEGASGLGGFGYFDTASRSFKIFSPPEIWEWSASALLVEPEAVWLGLVHAGEGWGMSGGLLRWDRASETVQHLGLKASVYQIMRSGDALYLGTDNGIEVLRDGQVNRYIVDTTPAGKFRVIECEGGFR